jgi:hypothetical protein
MGSFSCAALHSAWIEYMAGAVADQADHLAPAGLASATPTAAGMLWPRPPLHMV